MNKRLSLALAIGLATFNTWAEDRIRWQDWSAEAFTEAQANNKLILVNVGHEGCTACRFMENNTFSDKTVIELVNANFIAIQVDSEARPDIGERYSDWAWPANAFIRPDGTQVLAFAGSRRPDKYLAVLNKLIDGHAADTLVADELAPYGAPQSPATTALTELRDAVRATQDSVFKNKKSGIFENAEPLRHLLLRSHIYGDAEAQRMATATLDGLMHQLDSVWGGMFYASFGQWDNVVVEKRLESQAAALQVFTDGYQLTGDPVYRDAIDNVHRYLTIFMRSKEGTFFANQQDRLVNLPRDMNMDDYYALGDKDRRQYGIPTIDHTVYTDVNGRVILGYVMAFEATGNQSYLNVAITAAKHLLDKRQTKTGWMIQFMPSSELSADQRIHVLTDKPVPYLRTQADFGLALLSLYGATADPLWKQAAIRLANALTSEFEDTKLGGFYGAPDDGTPGRRKPLEDNAAAARFLYLLGVLVKNDEYKVSAERAIRASASPTAVQREGRITGDLAMALETLTAGYVEFSVVGDVNDPRTQELLQAGRRVYEPRKVVHIETAGRYPKRSVPAMYICNDETCSMPIFDPNAVPAQAKKLTYATLTAAQITTN